MDSNFYVKMKDVKTPPEWYDENHTKNFIIFNLVFVFPTISILLLNLSVLFSSYKDISSIHDLIVIIFLGISILIIIATYWLFLPKAIKKYKDLGYDESFSIFCKIFVLNIIIGFFSLILGILYAVTDNFIINWWKCLILGGIGLLNIMLIYWWKMPKEFKMRFPSDESKKK